MSNGLDPHQDWHSVGPDMGPNCLQTLRLSANNKIWLACREFKFGHLSFVSQGAGLAWNLEPTHDSQQ